MKQVTQVYNVFQYSELSDAAKEKAKNWYLDGQDPDTFTWVVKQDLEIYFPSSDLKIEYSLNYCQGDGLNIYGYFDFEDLLSHVKQHFSEKEKRTLQFYFSVGKDGVDIQSNLLNYTYCDIFNKDIVAELISDLEWNEYRDINTDLLYRFERAAQWHIAQLCEVYKRQGYDYFYEINDTDLAELCECNDWYFLEDGTFWD